MPQSALRIKYLLLQNYFSCLLQTICRAKSRNSNKILLICYLRMYLIQKVLFILFTKKNVFNKAKELRLPLSE